MSLCFTFVVALLVSLSSARFMMIQDPPMAINVCDQPKVMGRCRAAIRRWYYNSATGECERFYYGGCDGNQNRFNSKEECENECVDDESDQPQPLKVCRRDPCTRRRCRDASTFPNGRRIMCSAGAFFCDTECYSYKDCAVNEDGECAFVSRSDAEDAEFDACVNRCSGGPLRQF